VENPTGKPGICELFSRKMAILLDSWNLFLNFVDLKGHFPYNG
jgi:hypothetical protein